MKIFGRHCEIDAVGRQPVPNAMISKQSYYKPKDYFQIHKFYRYCTCWKYIFYVYLIILAFRFMHKYLYYLDKPNNKELNILIENHLKLNVLYEKGLGCVVPKLDAFSKEVLDVVKFDYRPKIVCPGTDWVNCYKSECYVTMEVKGDIVCVYRDIIYLNDNQYLVFEPTEVRGHNNYTLHVSDHVKINCTAQNKDSFGKLITSNWTGCKTGLRPVRLHPTPAERKNSYNVMILVFDSTSHNGFMRFMSKSYKYLTEDMNAVILNSYSAIGDNTITNMFPILTGKAKTEHPETRIGMGSKLFMDYKDFIFYQLKEVGYRTAYFDEISTTFSTYNRGFRRQPSDHYLKSFFEEAYRYDYEVRGVNRNYSFCIGAVPLYQLLLKITKDFLDLDGNKFCVTHISDIAHDTFNYIANADDDVVEFLRTIRERKMLEDTLVILMGDHGQRFGDLRHTYQGQIEKNLPLMAIILPERLKRLRPAALEALVHNKGVLTSHFDLHATLMDVLDMPFTNKYVVPGADLPRSISLLTKIPKSRTCSEAGILPDCCVCSHWYDLPRTVPEYGFVVYILVEHINNLIKERRDKCEIRELESIEWVRRQEFRENVKMDKKLRQHLYYTAIKKPPIEYYQVKIVMSPGIAIYEGTIAYTMKHRHFYVIGDNISRTNAYANESACISRTHPHLKQFCYCKT